MKINHHRNRSSMKTSEKYKANNHNATRNGLIPYSVKSKRQNVCPQRAARLRKWRSDKLILWRNGVKALIISNDEYIEIINNGEHAVFAWRVGVMRKYINNESMYCRWINASETVTSREINDVSTWRRNAEMRAKWKPVMCRVVAHSAK